MHLLLSFVSSEYCEKKSYFVWTDVIDFLVASYIHPFVHVEIEHSFTHKIEAK